MTKTDSIPIDIPTGTWQGIDAEMDNVSQTAYEDGDEKGGDYAMSIRAAGWAALGGVGASSPPDDHAISVTLDNRRVVASDTHARLYGDDARLAQTSARDGGSTH